MNRADDVVERPHLAAVGVPGQLQVHPARGGLLHLNRLVREQNRRPGRVHARTTRDRNPVRLNRDSPAMSLTPARSKAAAPRRIAVFSLRNGCTPSRSSSRSHENGSSTKYSWLPVTKNVPSRESKSRNGSAAGPSSSTVPSTRSPTIATRSGAASLIISDDPLGVRATRQRAEVDVGHHSDPEPVERWIEPAQAHRHPQQVRRTERVGRADADQAHRRRTGGHGTGPGEEHPPVHRRAPRVRPVVVIVSVVSGAFRFTLPRSASRTGSSTSSVEKEVHDQAEPEVARPREPRRLGQPEDARQRSASRPAASVSAMRTAVRIHRVRPGRVVSLTSRFQR